ncbi:neuromedin-U isoform X2 [Falco biarmicus]|uniref:Neuromedin U n=1 Tax=Falco tinnunculus TaxID=100819 RepID=A0A8C4VFY1_FALTI|nr:neuromedin-U isoform X2 [Falco rusticolus]XP_055554192.1 neuromedin-U isoform X2 [Falco cherrug]XP_055653051.1 neuromedin-U isoform X2 [Falco peregrinus]XP_056213693.1 neuromedin-U isoform X2 [Falco biarmicus]
MLVHVSGRFKKFGQGARACPEEWLAGSAGDTAGMAGLCQQPPAATPRRSPRKAGDGGALPGSPLLLLLLLASSMSACKGAPMPSQALEADEDLQLWKEIDDACSAYLSTDSQPQTSSILEELCFLVIGFLQKPQDLDEKDNTKRSSVLHPLLQLVPQLNERRLKRYKVDEELQGPGGIQSRGYFFYRPRNGRRSVDFR